MCIINPLCPLHMQHHLLTIRQTPGHPEDVWGDDPGSKAHAGWGIPLVHGWPAPSLPLRCGQGEVCPSAHTLLEDVWLCESVGRCRPVTEPTVFWHVQGQEPGSWSESHRGSDGSQRSAWRDGADVHHTEGTSPHAYWYTALPRPQPLSLPPSQPLPWIY